MAAAGLLVLSAPAAAVDGVVEINQTAALAGGITSGDDPGFPVTISRAGSYRLTGNLSTSDKASTAIEITADDVHLDLNGFSIACTFATGIVPAACLMASGPGFGVLATSGSDRTTLRNGTVRTMGFHGVFLRTQSSVHDVKSIGNGGHGIFVSHRSRLVGCLAEGNGEIGLSVGQLSRVIDSTSTDNGDHGIFTLGGSTVSGSIAEGNENDGIFASGAVVVRSQAIDNGAAGISIGSAGVAIGNWAHGNGGPGLQMTNGGYEDNVFMNNAGLQSAADEVVGGTPMGINVCQGSPCP